MKVFSVAESMNLKNSKTRDYLKVGHQSALWWFCAISTIVTIVFVIFYFLYPVLKLNLRCAFGDPDDLNNCLHQKWIKNRTNDSVDYDHSIFVLNPTELCGFHVLDGAGDAVKLLIIVSSNLKNLDRRNVIRETWGSTANWHKRGEVRMCFVVGESKDEQVTTDIRLESEKYDDVLQVGVEDIESSQTLKSILMLQWVAAWCPQTRYFLKVEDDTFVNIDRLLKMMAEKPFNGHRPFFSGRVANGTRPNRQPGRKHYVSYADYPHEVYPPHVSSSSYVTTGATVYNLSNSFNRIHPLLPLPEVHVTGLGALQIGANLLHDDRFGQLANVGDSQMPISSSFAIVNGISPMQMHSAWSAAIAHS